MTERLCYPPAPIYPDAQNYAARGLWLEPKIRRRGDLIFQKNGFGNSGCGRMIQHSRIALNLAVGKLPRAVPLEAGPPYPLLALIPDHDVMAELTAGLV